MEGTSEYATIRDGLPCPSMYSLPKNSGDLFHANSSPAAEWNRPEGDHQSRAGAAGLEESQRKTKIAPNPPIIIHTAPGSGEAVIDPNNRRSRR